MGNQQISFETTGDRWWWRSHDRLDCQTGVVVTMPDKAKITGVTIKVAGLHYTDRVYGYQNYRGRVRPAIWDYNTGKVLAKGNYRVLDISVGGTQPWESFDLPDTWVNEGQKIIVGFWRDSSTSSYATQWDWYDSADGMITVSQHLFGSDEGPFTFDISETFHDHSFNFILSYVAGGKVKVYNPNGGWQSRDVFVWDGDSWNAADVRFFDGSDWQETND